MNKKILAAAIGAALVAPLAAQADLKISGRVAGDMYSNNGVIRMADFGQGRLQLDASTDSGWFARMAKDTRLSTSDSATTPWGDDRDQFVGYKADFGSISLGRMGGSVANLESDPFIATFLEYRKAAVKGNSYGSASFNNGMLAYGNKFGDASVNIQYNPNSTGAGAPGLPGDMQFGVKTKIAGAGLYLGWNNEGNAVGGGFYKVGGAMSFGDIKGKLHYESDTTAGTAVTRFVLGAEMKMGGGLVDFSYGDKGADNTNAYYRLAYMKKFAKDAEAHAGFVNNGSGSAGNTSTFGVGATVFF